MKYIYEYTLEALQSSVEDAISEGYCNLGGLVRAEGLWVQGMIHADTLAAMATTKALAALPDGSVGFSTKPGDWQNLATGEDVPARVAKALKALASGNAYLVEI